MSGGGTPDKDAELRKLVGYSVKRANSALMGSVERLLGCHGLRRTTFSALSVIAGSPGLRQVDIADVLAIERPNLVQILDELQRSGLIERVRHSTDRRAYMLNITDAGRTRLAEANAALMAYDRNLTKGLSASERAALIAALRRVEDNGAEAWEGQDVGKIPTP